MVRGDVPASALPALTVVPGFGSLMSALRDVSAASEHFAVQGANLGCWERHFWNHRII